VAEKQVFPGQQEGEEVIIFQRRHWFVLLKWLLLPIFSLIPLSLVAWGVIRVLEPSRLAQAVIGLLFASPALSWIAWMVLDWWNDNYIVTDERVLHIERVYFLYESRNEAHLNRVQDVTVDIPDIIANLLYYGDVVIETAGTAGRIVFRNIAKPRKVQRLIFEMMNITPEEIRERLSWEPRRPRYQRLPEMMVRMFYPIVPTGDEVIVWRKHWWILLIQLGRPLMVIIALTLLWLLVAGVIRGYVVWVDALFAIGLAGVLIWLVLILVNWYNDLYILTPDHVIDIEKVPFISEHRREASLSMIQDVSYVQPSFLHKLLDFGNLRLETAGTAGEFTFDSVPHPQGVQQQIFERVGAFRRRAQEEEAQKKRGEIAAIVEDILREMTPGAPEE
jgi:uncharacterized membrane protein YdbT with pleckstrin-like domain